MPYQDDAPLSGSTIGRSRSGSRQLHRGRREDAAAQALERALCSAFVSPAPHFLGLHRFSAPLCSPSEFPRPLFLSIAISSVPSLPNPERTLTSHPFKFLFVSWFKRADKLARSSSECRIDDPTRTGRYPHPRREMHHSRSPEKLHTDWRRNILHSLAKQLDDAVNAAGASLCARHWVLPSHGH